MPLLPIAVRELRVGARRPGTYRLRVGAPAVALLLGSGYLLFYSNYSQVGQVVFQSITSLCFLYSFLAGLVFTADCLSREKRSGTLGLMFLTRLRGYDVILGKLAGTSLNAVYGLIAVLPVLALPVLVGGVTGTELAAVYLALLNTLFFSLAAGLAVSTFAEQEHRAIAVTFTLLLAVAFGGWLVVIAILYGGARYVQRQYPSAFASGKTILPAAGAVLLLLVSGVGFAQTSTYPVLFGFLLPSPLFGFYLIFDSGNAGWFGMFLASVFTTHLLGWLILALAAISINRSWRTTPATATAGSSPFPARAVARLFPGKKKPSIVSLLGDPKKFRIWIWTLLALLLAYHLGFARLVSGSGGTGSAMIMPFLYWVPFLSLRYLPAWQAGRFFIEARRSGMLEQLLVTPLDRRELIRGQWQFLHQAFVRPFLLLMAALAAIYLFCVLMDAIPAPTTWLHPYQLISLGSGLVTLVFDFLALSWVAMWLAWSVQPARQITGRAFAYIVLTDLLLYSLPFGFLLFRFFGLGFLSSLYFPLVIALKDWAFWAWAKKRLQSALGTELHYSWAWGRK